MTVEREGPTLLERLRADFDGTFAQPARAEAEESIALLAYRCGSGQYATRLEQVASLHDLRTVTPVPSRQAGFEGVVAVRGQLVAVYDLSSLLGVADVKSSTRRWMLLCREERQLGFVVSGVDGYRLFEKRRLVLASSASHDSAATRDAVEDGTTLRLLVDFSSLIAGIRRSFEQQGGASR